MIKNVIAFNLPVGFDIRDSKLNGLLKKKPFTPCRPTDSLSYGWTRTVITKDEGSESDLLAMPIKDCIVMRATIEKKAVPGSVLKQQVALDIKEYTAKSGYPPSKEEMKLLKEEAKRKLLPRAFPKRNDTLVWVDTKVNRLYIETSSTSTADLVLMLMRESWEDLPAVQWLRPKVNLSSLMNDWILDASPNLLDVDDMCEVVLPDTGKPSIKYNRHNLDHNEIKNYIREGHLVASLGLTYDDQLSFVLTDKFVLKSIKELKLKDEGDKGEELMFSATFLLFNYAISGAIETVIEAAGGLREYVADEEETELDNGKSKDVISDDGDSEFESEDALEFEPGEYQLGEDTSVIAITSHLDHADDFGSSIGDAEDEIESSGSAAALATTMKDMMEASGGSSQVH